MRWLRRTLSLACGLLAVATANAWHGSYDLYEQFGHERYTFAADHFHHRQLSLGSVGGQLIVHAASSDVTFEAFKFTPPDLIEQFKRRPTFFHRSITPDRLTAWVGSGGPPSDKLGFGYVAGVDTTPVVYDTARRSSFSYASLGHPMDRTRIYRTLAFPHWFALIVLLPLPLRSASRLPARARAIRARRRRRRGHCGACNYDLRATPGRCPECGAIFAVAPASNGA